MPFVVLAHAFLLLLESRRSLSVEPRRLFSLHSKNTLIQADGVEIYGLTVRRPRKSAIADAKIQTECGESVQNFPSSSRGRVEDGLCKGA